VRGLNKNYEAFEEIIREIEALIANQAISKITRLFEDNFYGIEALLK
jgi:hypothetical protein